MKTFEYEGMKLAYVDEGAGEAVVFVHGTPSSSREFAEVMEALKGEYRCVAMDHLGFGGSDKPADGAYGLEDHARRLGALVDGLGLERFHLVVHDFGGVIGLLMGLERWERVGKVVLMNTWGWPLEETEKSMGKQRRIFLSGVMRWLYLRWNFSARVLVKMGWGKRRPLTRERHRAFMEVFRNAGERVGTLRFLEALFDGGLPAWKVGERLVEKLEGQKGRVMIVWGGADRMVSKVTLQRWREMLPGAEVRVIEDAGHFVAEEAAEEVAPALRGFLRAAGARD